MNRFFKFSLFLGSFLFLFSIFLPSFCLASPDEAKNNEYGLITTTQDLPDAVKQEESAGTWIGRLIRMALSFVGVSFLGLTVYSGGLWMTAGGNEQQITKAKSLLIWASIGVAVVLMAYSIVSYLTPTISSQINK